LVLRSAAAVDAATGLIFPSNGTPGDANSTRFKFTSPLSWYPATYIWKYYPIQQDGYYTTFFHGQDDGAFSGAGYYGTHPYPNTPPSGSTHKWEVSAEGEDYVTDDNANDTTVVKGQWYDQMTVVRLVNTDELEIKFYWDMATSLNRVITFTTVGNYASNPTASPVLTFGDASWNPNSECMSGRFRGLQIYSATKTGAQGQTLQALTSNAAVVAHSDASSLWYVNLNPTPSDISDKSGNGNNPSWQNSNRPSLWTA
jgi:hypothetical protein